MLYIPGDLTLWEMDQKYKEFTRRIDEYLAELERDFAERQERRRRDHRARMGRRYDDHRRKMAERLADIEGAFLQTPQGLALALMASVIQKLDESGIASEVDDELWNGTP